FNYEINKREEKVEKLLYSPPPNKKRKTNNTNKEEKSSSINEESSNKVCDICNKAIVGNDFVTANKGTTIICKKCLLKM
ncbi:MAG: RusA family crossover junction endodeoxyribonuclease, partial [Clostridium perfringens]|nr:RusA family crossover junction endodeoxyribonuclease [Clostridium perfringens]